MATTRRALPERPGVLRRLFALALKRTNFPAAERRRLVGDIEKAVTGTPGVQPDHFGCDDWRGVAELIVRHFERIESLSARTFREFSAVQTRKGHESALRGLLFNQFVRHFKPLWKDLRSAARDSVRRLNEESDPRAPARLVNAHGKAVRDSGPFSETILSGQEVVIVLRKKGTKGEAPEDQFRVQSVDDVLISSASKPGGGTYWLFPAEVESKTPGAARGFGKQIAGTQVRFGDVDVVRVEVTINGKVVKIPAGSLVFDRHDSVEYAISAFSQARLRESLSPAERAELATAFNELDLETIGRMSQFRGQSTDRSGGISFRRLDLAVDISPINQLIRAALLAGSRARP
jgi:hypothetical protein